MINPYEDNLYRPKINKKNFHTIGRYSRFIKQFADENDWGFQKIHRWSWTDMESFFETETTSHTLKSTYNYTLTFVKGKYFGTGKNKQKINTIDDIFLIDRNSKDFPKQLETWNTTGKLTFPIKHHLCLYGLIFLNPCQAAIGIGYSVKI